MDVTGGQLFCDDLPPGSSKCQGFAGPQLGTKRDDLTWFKIWSTPNKKTPRVVIGGFKFAGGFLI